MTRFARFKERLREKTGLGPVPFSVLFLTSYFFLWVVGTVIVQLVRRFVLQ